jgi:Na+/melibiose symporter-like transporter
VSLPRATKLGYGAAELGVLATETLARLHVLKFYTDVVGLEAAYAGAAAAIAIVWDAFADLTIGLVSDRTRSRWGRRRPYLLAGGVALAISVIALFHPIRVASQLGMAALLCASFLVMNTAVSLLSVPHTALATELTDDEAERTALFGYRLFLGNVGLLAGAILPGALLAQDHSERGSAAAYGSASFAVGALILASATISFLATRGRDVAPPDPSPMRLGAMSRSAAAVVTDRNFLPLLAAYVVAQLGVAVNGTFALYYYEYRLELSADQVSAVLAVFVTAWSLSIPAWVLASHRWGKRALAFFGITLLGLSTAVIYLLAPPRSLVMPMTIAVVGGGLAGSIVLLEALVADVVDADRLLRRGQREGVYFGVWRMAAKLARGLAVAGSGAALTWIGFVPNQAQSPEVSERLAWLFGPGVGVFFVLGALIFLTSPLDDAMTRRVRFALAKRRARRREPERLG